AADIPAQQLGRLLHPIGVGRRVIDDRVPLLSLEGAELSVAIPDETNDRLRNLCVVAATREDRDLMAARHRVIDEVRSDETGAAEDEDAEWSGSRCAARRRRLSQCRQSASEQNAASGCRGFEKVASIRHTRKLRGAAREICKSLMISRVENDQ